jgi:hypothetical protein
MRALLIFIANRPALPRKTGRALQPSKLEANGVTLIEKWENAELPLMFVEHASLAAQDVQECARAQFDAPATLGSCWASRNDCHEYSDPLVRPRPGDLVFQPQGQSLFRSSRFNRFFEDLGGPLLILVSDDLEGLVMETAIDSFLTGHPMIVVSDAVPLGAADVDEISASRSNSLMPLSCFARIVKTEKLLQEWTMP